MKLLEKTLTRLSADKKRFCRVDVTLEEGNVLSITGVAGITNDGCARDRVMPDFAGHRLYAESFGQVVEEIALYFPELQKALPFHLNHMRAGCEHQRAAKWGENEVELVTWKLKTDALIEQQNIERAAVAKLKEGKSVTLEHADWAVLNLPYEVTKEPVGGYTVGRYEVKSRERKLTQWIRPDEHPEGVLMKPCPTCGYKFGSAWVKEELPAEIVDLVRGLK